MPDCLAECPRRQKGTQRKQRSVPAKEVCEYQPQDLTNSRIKFNRLHKPEAKIPSGRRTVYRHPICPNPITRSQAQINQEVLDLNASPTPVDQDLIQDLVQETIRVGDKASARERKQVNDPLRPRIHPPYRPPLTKTTSSLGADALATDE